PYSQTRSRIYRHACRRIATTLDRWLRGRVLLSLGVERLKILQSADEANAESDRDVYPRRVGADGHSGRGDTGASGAMANPRQTLSRRDWLLWCLLAYAAASLFHYSHNAQFLADYPNLPAWLTRSEVYAAWAGVTAVGLAGYLLTTRGHRVAGLLVLTVYALIGFDGLGHYAVAPMAAHTLIMNVSIWLEVATAAAVVAAIVARTARVMR